MKQKVPENVNIFREAICLRDTRARLLGYKNHGSFRIDERALKSVEYVEQLLGRLR
jgi:metallopeptidase MepB